jgi:hypothetical protein
MMLAFSSTTDFTREPETNTCLQKKHQQEAGSEAEIASHRSTNPHALLRSLALKAS